MAYRADERQGDLALIVHVEIAGQVLFAEYREPDFIADAELVGGGGLGGVRGSRQEEGGEDEKSRRSHAAGHARG